MWIIIFIKKGRNLLSLWRSEFQIDEKMREGRPYIPLEMNIILIFIEEIKNKKN